MRCLALPVVLGVLGACDTQVDSDYAGEPLASLHGSMVAVGPVEVRRMVMLWSGDDPTGLGALASPLALTTGYPAEFTADVIEVPPADARLAFPGEPAFAEGYVFALDENGNYVGSDFDHALVWLSAPVAAETMTGSYLGGAVGPGFAVVERHATDALSPAEEVLEGRCTDRALAMGWEAARADSACRALHAYRLLPAPQGLSTRWQIHVIAGGP